MPNSAIVESGGKQYRVEEGQSLLVDRISEDEGAKVPLRAVMFSSDEDTVLAAKDLAKVKVEARVAGHERGEKIRVFKYKAKKGYRKRQGHRSELTRLEVTEVAMLTRKPAARKKAEDAGEMPKADEVPKEAPQASETPEGGLPESIGKPATRALEEAGLTTLEQVANKTEAELLELKGVGPKAVEAVKEALADAGLSLQQNDDNEETD
jgi:large subunit ribosomal protein L21